MTNTKNPRFLDLDAIVPDTSLGVKIGGVSYEMSPLNIGDFVKNLKAARLNESNPEKQITSVKEILKRSFKTITDEVLDTLNFPQLLALKDYVQKHNGQTETEAAAEADAVAANPPTPES